MGSSVHIDNKKKDVLILGKYPTQGLGQHSLTAEKNLFNQLYWNWAEILFEPTL